MTDKEFMEIYGRLPRRKTRVVKKTKIYWNRIIIALILLIGIIWGIVQLFSHIFSKPEKQTSAKTSVVSTENKKKKTSEKTTATDMKKSFTVCIDPGHGYDDAGTANQDGTRFEKDDNLAISLLIQKHLEDMGVNVVMTRTDDTNLSMADRCKIANDSKADFTLCIHRNSYDGDEKVNGVEIWVNNCEPMEDTLLSQRIMDELNKVGITQDRGVQYGYLHMENTNYFINADTVMPSCLVELGFMTDEDDNKMFDEKKDKYAKAIAEGTIKAAIELGLVDENGSRLVDGEFLSKSKYINTKSSDDSDDNNNVADKYYTDSTLDNMIQPQTENGENAENIPADTEAVENQAETNNAEVTQQELNYID